MPPNQSSSSRRKKGKHSVQNLEEIDVHRSLPLHLPFEIWSLIFSWLSVDDLTRVARVSTTILPICRMAIYRTLSLRNDNQSFHYTFALLRHVDGLGSFVRHITFFTAWAPWAATWLHFDVLTRFSSLRSLTLIGSPFATEAEQSQFLEIVGRVCPALRAFTYVPFSPTLLPGPSLAMRNLTNVTWPNYLASSPEPQCLSLLITSSHTITTLALPMCPGYPIAKRSTISDTWATILGLRFPNLVSFTLGLLYPDRISERHADTTLPITKFLFAHPTLQHVALGCSTQFAHLYEGITASGGNLVTTDFLPALRSLETHPANLAIMVRQRVRVLQTLPRLVLSYFCTPRQDMRSGAVAELILALQGTPGLPFTTTLALDFSAEFDEIEPAALAWVRQLGAYFPAVVAWSGHLGAVSPGQLAEALQPYNLVKTVSLPRTTLVAPLPGGSLTGGDFVGLAGTCQQLRTLFIRAGKAHSEGMLHTFSRAADGTLVSVMVTPQSA